MRWIKLYGNTLNDKRLLDLRNDYGFQGIGVYCALLLQVECLGEGAQHIDTLTGLFNRKVSRKLIQSVLLDYGLFSVDQLGMVRSKDRIPGYSPDDMTELRRTDTVYSVADGNNHVEIVELRPVFLSRTTHLSEFPTSGLLAQFA